MPRPLNSPVVFILLVSKYMRAWTPIWLLQRDTPTGEFIGDSDAEV